MTAPRVDLGHGHWLEFTAHYGDDSGQRCGAIVYHPIKPDDQTCAWRNLCGGYISFDIPANAGETRAKWQVVQMEPLTLSPSLACHCGDHGFIREGRWVPA